SPANTPRAAGRQNGAASPARLGTNTTWPASIHAPPSRSRSSGPWISPTSCSQLPAAPAVYTWPSRQYVVASPICHATQATSPAPERRADGPTLVGRKETGPYVHLVSPAPTARSP